MLMPLIPVETVWNRPLREAVRGPVYGDGIGILKVWTIKESVVKLALSPECRDEKR